MIRLFTGLAIPPDITAQLARLQSGLVGARWIEPENFHITLTFIGVVAEDLAGEIDQQLGEGCFSRCGPVALRLAGVGSFGHGRPRAIWAGVQATGDLDGLKAASDAAVARAGLDIDTRKFTPHVTLARLRSRGPAQTADYLARQSNLRTPEFAVGEVMLFSARTRHGGGPYVAERRYPLVDKT